MENIDVGGLIGTVNRNTAGLVPAGFLLRSEYLEAESGSSVIVKSIDKKGFVGLISVNPISVTFNTALYVYSYNELSELNGSLSSVYSLSVDDDDVIRITNNSSSRARFRVSVLELCSFE